MKLSVSLRIYVAVLVGVMFSSLSYAGQGRTQDPVQLLTQMTQAFSQLNYDGVFVHSEDNSINSMRVQHLIKGDKEYERLFDLDGHKLSVIRIDDTVTCVCPNPTKVMADQQKISSAPFKRFRRLDGERLKLGYDLIVRKKMKRIAGRDVLELRLVPKDAYRFEHDLWLDQHNSFLLKHDMKDQAGNLLDRIQFTSVVFNPDLKEGDFVPNKDSYSQKVLEPQSHQVKSQWKFDWLPDGFALVWPEARALNHGTSMLLLSDGMATISIFIEPTKHIKPLSYVTMGATVAGEKTLKVGEQLYLVTMVGEVPEVTIEKLISVFMPKANS